MLFALLRSYCAHFLRIKERQEPFGQPLGGSWAIYEACVFITEPGLTLAYLKCRAKWSAVIYRLSLQHFSLHPGPLCMKTNKTFVRQLWRTLKNQKTTLDFVRRESTDVSFEHLNNRGIDRGRRKIDRGSVNGSSFRFPVDFSMQNKKIVLKF